MYRTVNGLAVLNTLDTDQWRYISQVASRTLLDYGQVQQALRRFESAGLVVSKLEEAEEADSFEQGWRRFRAKRAQRRYYRLTADGVAVRAEWQAREAHRH